MKRLSFANILALPKSVRRPKYDRAKVKIGVVHLGIGAFHRAHVAAYFDQILESDLSWGIIGASLRKPDTRQALAPQDFLYSQVVRSGQGDDIRVIGSLLNVLDATTQREELIVELTNPNVRIVSLTVTEKGYCHDPATGKLDRKNTVVVHDLAHPEAPISTIGLLVHALELRRMAGAKPFTVLSCDNLPSNGETVARLVTEFASLRSKELADFIIREVTFPSTMVDRIVPATTAEDRTQVARQTGLEDAWPVVTEPFTQWVIEDKFCAGRPDFAKVGIQLVSDVKPFEHMKLRMLNGSHSTLAYLGYLAGYDYVAQAIADPAFHKLIYGLMTQEVMPTLTSGLDDLTAYRDALLQRFANPALKHRTWQIAMDGSQKLPQRLLGTIRDQITTGQSIHRLALGVAAWMRYVTGIDEKGAAIDVRDPLAQKLRAVAAVAGQNYPQLVRGLLQVKEIFGEDLPYNQSFTAEVESHLSSLFAKGSLKTVQQL
ncbi:MAG: mannitol dehydrogenase family protein [Pseudomonadota bacterium]|nr:mannitol dehydrogenase family protein [Pseudomonadota bacterium]